MIFINFFIDFLENVVNFVGPQALKERERFSVESTIQLDEPGGLPSELLPSGGLSRMVSSVRYLTKRSI